MIRRVFLLVFILFCAPAMGYESICEEVLLEQESFGMDNPLYDPGRRDRGFGEVQEPLHDELYEPNGGEEYTPEIEEAHRGVGIINYGDYDDEPQDGDLHW